MVVITRVLFPPKGAAVVFLTATPSVARNLVALKQTLQDLEPAQVIGFFYDKFHTRIHTCKRDNSSPVQAVTSLWHHHMLQVFSGAVGQQTAERLFNISHY